MTLTQVRAITVSTQQANAPVRNGLLTAAGDVSDAIGTRDGAQISAAFASGGKPVALGSPEGSIQNLGAVNTVRTTLNTARDKISASAVTDIVGIDRDEGGKVFGGSQNGELHLNPKGAEPERSGEVAEGQDHASFAGRD